MIRFASTYILELGGGWNREVSGNTVVSMEFKSISLSLDLYVAIQVSSKYESVCVSKGEMIDCGKELECIIQVQYL